MNYLKFPKFLLKDERYSALPDSAKLLYTLMLDRVSLSEKNGWFDERGNVYIIFTQKEATRLLSPSKRTIYELFNMLKKVKLIETGGKRKGAYIFYVNIPGKAEFATDRLHNLQVQDAKNTSDRLHSLQVNNNYINKTETTKNKKSHSSTHEGVKDDPLLLKIIENCELEIWKDGTDIIMENAIRRMYHAKNLNICGRKVGHSEILKNLLLLTGDSVIFAQSKLKECSTNVRNEQNYLMALLFNAPYDYAIAEAINSQY